MVDVSDDLLEFLAAWEGCELEIYEDAAGLATIGVGHLIRKGEKSKFKNGLTHEEAMELLREDIKTAADCVSTSVLVPLEQHQFDALVSFVFNVGSGAFIRSTLLRVLNDENYDEVFRQLPLWKRAGGKVLQGLIRRRAAEVEIWRFRNYSSRP